MSSLHRQRSSNLDKPLSKGKAEVSSAWCFAFCATLYSILTGSVFLKQYGHKTSVVSVNGHFQYSETRCIPRVTLKKLFAYVNLLGMKSASKFQIQPLKHLLVIYRVSLIDTEL